MGFLCEAPQGAVHNHWARPQPRQACPSHEEKGGKEGGKKIFPRCPFTLSFLPLCPSILLFHLLKKNYTLTTTPTLFFLLSLPVGPCPPLNPACAPLTRIPKHVSREDSFRETDERTKGEKERKSRSAVRGEEKKDKVNRQRNTRLGCGEKKPGWRARSLL